MASDVDLVNRALTKIGAQRITSLSDDIEAARTAASLFDIVRDAELRARNWNFAMARASLAALLTTPAWGFDLEYQLPSDCLRVVQVDEYLHGNSLTNYREVSEAAYQIEGRKILTNLAAPLPIRYVSRVTDTGTWDSAFAEAFACRLAAEMAERLTASLPKRDAAWSEYMRAVKEAARGDSIENPPEPLPDNSWITARL